MSDKKQQLERFRIMLQELNEIKKEIEQKKRITLFTLEKESIDERIAGYAIGGYFGVSEFFYEKGPGTVVDWMIGVEISRDRLAYVYEKLHIFTPDEIKKFDTKEQFIEFLKTKELIKE